MSENIRNFAKNKKKMNKEEFIKKAREVHGSKYDYSKVEYSNSKTKVCIICPGHGEFFQSSNAHLQGKGCPKCGINIRIEKTKMSTAEFIAKAQEIHGNKYDYSKTEYSNSRTKVCIICPDHGEFWQTPTLHLQGNGCPKCSGKNKLTTEEFIEKARKVHGDKYDYSKVDYKNNHTKVCIICPDHGEFWQTPSNHLKKQGCPKCGFTIRNEKNTMTTEEFIAKAREVHGSKYDYSKSEYQNCNVKVCIICPEHGEFWQLPSSHLSGRGCPKCINRKY